MNAILKLTSIFLISFGIFSQQIFAQSKFNPVSNSTSKQQSDNLIFSTCYTVSSEEGQPNILFEYNPATKKWNEVGITGGTSISAIATDPVNNLIYAVDGGTFGIINPATGKFTPYGSIGSGKGSFGTVLFDNITGLTYDPVNEILYGVQYLSIDIINTDLLFQIDVSTGKLVPETMMDLYAFSPADYASITKIRDLTDLPKHYEVNDIAYNTYNGKMYAIHKYGFSYRMIEIDQVYGTVKSTIYAGTQEYDLRGIGFTGLGELYGTMGNMGFTDADKNNFVKIDLLNGETTLLDKIDPDGGVVNFEAFDCFTTYNDLALKMEADASIEQPLSLDNNIIFFIEVFNQGKIANSDIQLVNYIPAGLILYDAFWTDLENGTATYTINQTIQPGSSTKISIRFKVDDFVGTSITNAVEIAASFHPQVTDDFGNLIPLPDWDSNPDDQDDEVNFIEINGGEPYANQDEDDHDVAIIEIEGSEVTLPYNSATPFNCYAVSEDDTIPNILFEYNPTAFEWKAIGITGTAHLEALATDPATGIIYATDAGTFGTIDAKTALFKPIGKVGSGNGDAGLVNLNDVDGLTYDPINQIMYATHRVDGSGKGTNDLLFQIDVATGKVITGAMQNGYGNPVDYSIIPHVNQAIGADLYNVADIAYNPYDGNLYAIQNQEESSTITQLDPLNGQILSKFFKSNDDLEGLGINYNGGISATTGVNSNSKIESNAYFNVSFTFHGTYLNNSIDPSNQFKDFEAFDCFTAKNDLALMVETTAQQVFNRGSEVTFEVTIYNQGDLPNTQIELINYIPDGLILADDNWREYLDKKKAAYTFNGVLEPGKEYTTTITFQIVLDFEGQSITNAAEIAKSYQFPDNRRSILDWDSNPDNKNNETLIEDNELNGSGPHSKNNEDEDDHDIAVIQIQQAPCPAYLVLPDEELSGYYQAQQEIEIKGYVEKPKTAVFKICEQQ